MVKFGSNSPEQRFDFNFAEFSKEPVAGTATTTSARPHCGGSSGTEHRTHASAGGAGRATTGRCGPTGAASSTGTETRGRGRADSGSAAAPRSSNHAAPAAGQPPAAAPTVRRLRSAGSREFLPRSTPPSTNRRCRPVRPDCSPSCQARGRSRARSSTTATSVRCGCRRWAPSPSRWRSARTPIALAGTAARGGDPGSQARRHVRVGARRLWRPRQQTKNVEAYHGSPRQLPI